MCHMVTLYRQIAGQATILVVNPDKMSVPAKLRSRRVREFVLLVSRDLRALGVRREACRCQAVIAVTWDCLDLYTVALDLAEDDDLRFLLQQARGTILASLVAQTMSASEIVSVLE